MAKIVPQVTRTLENGYVQVEIARKDKPTKCYKMPTQYAENFCKNYNKNGKKMRLISDLFTFTFAVGGFSLIHKLNKSLKGGLRVLTSVGGCFITAAIGTLIGTKIAMNDYKTFMQSHQAEEFKYQNQFDQII